MALTLLDKPKVEKKEKAPDYSKYSEQKPSEFLLNIADRLRQENESRRSKKLAQAAYQMCRRHRGQTPRDLFGYWEEDIWYENSPIYNKLHSTNIFQALIRGAEANFVQSDIKLEINATKDNWQSRALRKIAQSLYEILKPQQWTESAIQSAFYAKILKLNGYYVSRFDGQKGPKSVSMPEFEEASFETGGMYICPECYHSGTYSEVKGVNKCGKCGNEKISVIDEPQVDDDEVVSGFEQKRSGEPEMVVADGLDFSVDPNGEPADVESCAWIEWRYRSHRNKLKRLYPHAELQEGKAEWSYQTRLKIGLQRFSPGETYPQSEFDKDSFEVRQIWLDLQEYEDYIPNQDEKIGDTEIKAGVPISKQFPDGMVFATTSHQILFVDNENKNDVVCSSLWLSDGENFEGVGASAGLAIQKKINHLDNMAMQGEARALRGAIAYVPEAIDGQHLEGQNVNIPLRPDFATQGQPIKNFLQPLDASGLSGDSLMFLQSQSDTMQKVMGVPDVTLGQDSDTDDTYGGQRLRARNALGLLTPATRSLALAMEKWLLHQLLLIQKYMAPEAMYALANQHGEEWQQDEMEAFYDANLKKDLSIQYVPGSEVPETRFDRQIRLRQDIANQMVPLTPELQAQLANEAGFDLDVGNFESNRKLAEQRYNFIKEGMSPDMEEMYYFYEEQVIDPNTGLRAMDESGQPLPNPLLEQVAQAQELKIYQEAENHEQMVEFWSDKVRLLASSGESQLFIELCQMMATRHIQATFEMGLKQNSLEALAQLPMQAGQQAIGAEQEYQQQTQGSNVESSV